QKIRAMAAELDSDDAYHVTGLPVAEDTFGHEMFVQMGISAPLAAAMIFLLMWYFFRSWQLVLAPILVAMATVVVTMGTLIGAGFTVHIMSSMIPIFLMPIAVVDAVHIMSELADRWHAGGDAGAGIRNVISTLFQPMLYTSLTSAAGFASLLLTPIPPVQVFGGFVAFGILLAFLLTIVLIPAYVVRMKPSALARLERTTSQRPQDSLLARGLRRIGRLAFGHGKAIIGVSVLLVALSVAGIFRIEINDNPVRWFKSGHAIRVADRVLNAHFAGTYDAFLVLTHADEQALPRFRETAGRLLERLPTEMAAGLRALIDADAEDPVRYYGDILTAADDRLFEADDPKTSAALEGLTALAERAQSEAQYFQHPEPLAWISELKRVLAESDVVGKTNALPDVVRVVNRELKGGADADYAVPDSRAGVAQTLLQYQSSHRPQDLWHMVTPDYTSTAIWVQLKSGDNQDMTRVMAAVDGYVADHPLPAGVEMRWAGKTFINVVWQDAMVSGMARSLLGAFAVVLVMMVVLFRSVRLGLLAMVPLSVTITAVYGIIGWIGKDYDMPIAVLSSLTLGLSIDFAIHFIERARALLRGGAFADVSTFIFEEPARAIARNAIVIAVGFTPLFFAPLVPYVTVGAFMAAIMTLSAFSTLVLLPAVMAVAGPRLFRGFGRQTAAEGLPAEAA
ncbi:MAG TPA: MMPL family transporter, partial [Woeseiaceae bacterium]|nr:MMPL family transporter [Woeseiaceae bacterium]